MVLFGSATTSLPMAMATIWVLGWKWEMLAWTYLLVKNGSFRGRGVVGRRGWGNNHCPKGWWGRGSSGIEKKIGKENFFFFFLFVNFS